jgi:hypothetical protein
MKKKNMFMIFSALIMSVVFINPSYAGECSVSDPCQTYAEVDSSGVVVNTLVCQPSVCEQMWGGVFPPSGNRLVAQVAADNNGNNRGGILGNKDSGVQVKESQGTFTIHDNNETTTTVVSAPNSTASITKSNSGTQSFNYNDTINPTTSGTVVDLGPKKFEPTTVVVVTADTPGVEVEKTFDSAVTEQTFEDIMKDKTIWDFPELLLIDSFFEFWLESLLGWFLLG